MITGFVGVVVLLVVAAVLVGFLMRRLRLLRAGGVHVALRRRMAGGGPGWQLGVGRYRGDEFVWYRALSVRSGPDHVIPRLGLEIADRRAPSTPETYTMPVGATVLRCRGETGELELAMDSEAMTGFLSWLESSPPGRAIPWSA
jgi:hypothetical protein